MAPNDPPIFDRPKKSPISAGNDHPHDLIEKGKKYDQVKKRMDECIEALKWFVKRCETGEVRSKKTYTRFKKLIKNCQND